MFRAQSSRNYYRPCNICQSYLRICACPRFFKPPKRRQSDDSTVFGTDLRSDRNNSVGMATRYCLDGRGFESHWEWDFPCSPDMHWSQSSLPHNKHRFSFPGVKRPGRRVNHPPTCSAEVKKRVELYLYLHGLFRAILVLPNVSPKLHGTISQMTVPQHELLR